MNECFGLRPAASSSSSFQFFSMNLRATWTLVNFTNYGCKSQKILWRSMEVRILKGHVLKHYSTVLLRKPTAACGWWKCITALATFFRDTTFWFTVNYFCCLFLQSVVKFWQTHEDSNPSFACLGLCSIHLLLPGSFYPRFPLIMSTDLTY